ncbi:hypothetical protein BTR23_04250 [Alkalihalophilus pseudofirmus]|nr:hypothetical protein BTR23_04250 [Alkalihalophilus pseudofirmus]
MEKEVQQYFNGNILLQAASRFQLPFSSLKELGNFENYVYEGTNPKGEDVVLRLTHSSHRTKEQIEAELHWLSYLKKNKAPACGCLPSIHGNAVETIQAESTSFYASLFEKAEGHAIKVDAPSFHQALITKWGETIGTFHRLTRHYEKPDYIMKRPDLIEEYASQFAPFLPADQPLREKVKHVLESISALPKTSERYGLIHSDIHSGNFFYDEKTNKISVFDFDDCSYHHFISDIAIPVYYTTWLKISTKEARTEYSHNFLTDFLKGYQVERAIPLDHLYEIPLFLKLRDCELYGVLHKKWDTTNLNNKQKNLLNEIYQRIMNDEPIIDLNIDRIIHSL